MSTASTTSWLPSANLVGCLDCQVFTLLSLVKGPPSLPSPLGKKKKAEEVLKLVCAFIQNLCLCLCKLFSLWARNQSTRLTPHIRLSSLYVCWCVCTLWKNCFPYFGDWLGDLKRHLRTLYSQQVLSSSNELCFSKYCIQFVPFYQSQRIISK